MPARILIPELRTFLSRFHWEVRAEIHRQAIDHLQPPDRNALAAGFHRKLGREEYSYYMSCVMTGEAVGRRATRLIHRGGFDVGAFQGQLTDMQCIPSENLGEFPAIGYLLEEVLVNFAYDEADGLQAVSPDA